MSQSNHAALESAEGQFLAGLRARYEKQGFTFTVAPAAQTLPDFLASYVPDAVARKPDMNVAIELKRRHDLEARQPLQDIRRLFEGRSDWRFDVVFKGGDALESITIPAAPPALISARLDEVHELKAEGQNRAALVMGWSLLEAALHSVNGAVAAKPQKPGTVLEALAMSGYIEREVERRLRSLIEVRNRIIHGDLSVEPAAGDIDLILSVVSETIAAEAA